MSTKNDRSAGVWGEDETLAVEHPDSLHGNARNLTGQRFGRLQVTLPTTLRYGESEIMWLCRCTCGTWTVQPTSSLTGGGSQSCGCYTRDLMSRLGSRTGKRNRLDLTGQRFGRLVAVEPTEERSYGCVVWRCRCDCGRTHKVKSGNLTSGHTQSCGCSRYSDDPADWFADSQQGENR